MKRLIGALFILTLALVLVSSPVAGQSEPIVIKYMTFLPKNNPVQCHFGQMFVDLLEKRSKGELKVKYVGGPEAIPFYDQVKALSDGLFDMNLAGPDTYMNLVPEVEALVLSKFSPQKEKEVGFYDLMVEYHKKANLRFLARMGKGKLPYFYIFLTKPVARLEDMRDLKIRVAPALIDFAKALGAVPISMPPSEIYTAMERGVVNGFTWPWVGVTNFGWIKVIKGVIDHPYRAGNAIMLMNLTFFNKLPAHLQKLLVEVCHEVQPEIEALNDRMHEEERARWKEAKIEFIRFSPEEAERYLAFDYDITWKRLMEKSPEGGVRIKQILAK